ncbi:hypothetical protein SCA6_008240 [Theobroma cacao]
MTPLMYTMRSQDRMKETSLCQQIRTKWGRSENGNSYKAFDKQAKSKGWHAVIRERWAVGSSTDQF